MINEDFTALWLSLRLATIVTLLLLVIGTPLAWWLSQTKNRLASSIEALIALPLYLLIVFSPESTLSRFWRSLTGDNIAFSFEALVIASIIYSIPFVVQPLQSAFQRISREVLESAATMGASSLDRFCTIVLPQSKAGFIAATTLGFAHTVGEFGVVLMIGGNISGETRVLSIALFDRVETLQYTAAHWLAGGLLLFSFLALLLVYRFNRPTVTAHA